jgi:dihydrofolate reductase
MNAVTKIVFSKTLEKVEWGKYDNARLVHDILPDGLEKMKKLSGKDMVIYGSASIVRQCTRLGLIDEFQLLVHPVILGAGTLLF